VTDTSTEQDVEETGVVYLASGVSTVDALNGTDANLGVTTDANATTTTTTTNTTTDTTTNTGTGNTTGM